MDHNATMPNWRRKLKNFFDNTAVHTILGLLILVNIFTLGMETSESLMASHGSLITGFNHFVLSVFAIEVTLRVVAEGKNFFKDGWHTFDFIIVFLAVISFGGLLQVFRGLRILWLLRMLTIAPQFKHLIGSIVRAIPHVLTVGVLLVLAIYMAALIGTVEFSHTTPELFGSIKVSMGTLAKTMLMEHTWSERYEVLSEHHDLAWMYIFPTMIILNYLLLHLVLGVVVTAIHKQYEEDENEKKSAFLEKFFKKEHKNEENPLSPDTKAILQTLEEMKSMLKKKES